MRPLSLIGLTFKWFLTLGLAGLSLSLGQQLVETKSQNESLSLQLKMVTQKVDEIVALQVDRVDLVESIEKATNQQITGTVATAHLKDKWGEIEKSFKATQSDLTNLVVVLDTEGDSDMDSALAGLETVKANLLASSSRLDQLSNSIEARTNFLAHIPSIKPADGWISSKYGRRASPINGKRDHHKGMDIAARKGTPVIASADGVVKEAGWRGAYGKAVEIDHGNGLTTLYAHNGKLFVKTGDPVVRGQKIGQVGLTGRTTGAHLHYEVRRNGNPINPSRYLKLAAVQPHGGEAVETFAPQKAAVANKGDNQPTPVAVSATMEETKLAALAQTAPVQEVLPDFSNTNGSGTSVASASVTSASVVPAPVASMNIRTVATAGSNALPVSVAMLVFLLVVKFWSVLSFTGIMKAMINVPFKVLDIMIAGPGELVPVKIRARSTKSAVRHW